MAVLALIAILAFLACGALANPIEASRTTVNPHSTAETSGGLSRLREPRLNKRNKNGGYDGAVVSNQFMATWASGTFNVPEAHIPYNPLSPVHAHSAYISGAIWVGIYGTGDNTALWQAGVSFSVSNEGIPDAAHSPTARPWHDWCDHLSCDAQVLNTHDFSVEPGDTVSVTVSGFANFGTAVFYNNSTGKSYTAQVGNSTSALIPNTVYWIVEDPALVDPVAFPRFNPTITWTGCTYANWSGDGQDLTDAQYLNQIIQPDGRPVASVDPSGPHGFTVTYNGTSY